MSNIQQAYGSAAQTLTCTIASLTNTSARASTAVDNSSGLYLDVLVQVKVKTGGSIASPTNSAYINVYAYATVDPSGPTYPEGVTGTDGSVTIGSPSNLKLIGVLATPATNTAFVSEPFSVAAAFGGVMPTKWGIVIENQTGGTLDSTEGNHAKLYQGVFATAS